MRAQLVWRRDSTRQPLLQARACRMAVQTRTAQPPVQHIPSDPGPMQPQAEAQLEPRQEAISQLEDVIKIAASLDLGAP